MRIKLVIISLLLTGFFPLLAQQGLKFGHIDTNEIFSALPELQEVQKQLDAEYEKHETSLTTMQEELKAKQQEYINAAKTLTPSERSAKEKELVEMNQRIQNFYSLAQQQIQAKELELKSPLIEKIQKAINEVGQEQGFIYIFDSTSGVPVYHSEKSVDIAPLVKAKLGIQ